MALHQSLRFIWHLGYPSSANWDSMIFIFIIRNNLSTIIINIITCDKEEKCIIIIYIIIAKILRVLLHGAECQRRGPSMHNPGGVCSFHNRCILDVTIDTMSCMIP